MQRKTHPVRVGKVVIGGSNPIAVQSMTSTRTEDVESTLSQIEELVAEGCELVRIAIPDKRALEGFKLIRGETRVPLIADIHFNYRLAIGSIEAGADKVRINPGNIGGEQQMEKVVDAAKMHSVPIRIGINSGSLEVELIDRYGGVNPRSLTESAMKWARFLEDRNFTDIVLSVKSSSVPQTIESYRQLSRLTDHPLHLGITEAGPRGIGSIKSAIGIGSLLMDGIGDTIRVSLTSNPVHEVKVAWDILKALELRARGPIIISCPTCGRVRIDLLSLVERVEKALERETFEVKVAVMGCEVNGPGEAREADVGVAAAPGFGLIFRKGDVIRKVPEAEILNELLKEIDFLKQEAGFKEVRR